MRTLHPAWRVSDLDASLRFYRAVGYGVAGSVGIGGGATLTMLKLADDPFISLELVYRPAEGPVQTGGFSHIAVQVDDLAATIQRLTGAGLTPGPIELPAGPNGPHTAWLTDPDGYRIELVQWPPGHAAGMTEADFVVRP